MTAAGSQGPRSLLWFRKGLRLHDNPALLEAVAGAQGLYPCFCLDPWFLTPSRVGTNRLAFLLASLADLDAGLRARGSRLLLLRGKPTELLPAAMQAWGITKLCYEVDTEPYACERDAQVTAAARAAGVSVCGFVSHTLYDTAKLVAANGGAPPLTYGAFQKLAARLGPPPPPAPDAPARLPGVPPDDAVFQPQLTTVPTLAQLGYTDAPSTFIKGGESEALARLAEVVADPDWVAAFEKPKGNPAAFIKPATTVLSPHLKFGCLSARLFYQQLQAIIAPRKGATQPPVSLVGQLLWREFFYCAASATPNFDRMAGNAIVKQIDWDDNEEYCKAWEEGRTGYPWIDAIMLQLQRDGWMHHLARHSVACFLTRGDLYCSWERGAQVFDRLLVDSDWSINNANWMWLSASAFFSQYFRVYSPISFGQKYDPEGAFIRHYLPVLKDFPAKFIYEPWKAPLAAQRAAGCVIGVDYPAPIVDHAIVHKVNIGRIKAAYDASKGAAAAAGSASKRAAAAAGGASKDTASASRGPAGGAVKAGGKRTNGAAAASTRAPVAQTGSSTKRARRQLT